MRRTTSRHALAGLTAAVTTVLVAGLAPAAQADTSATFTVAGSALSISTPTSRNLGTGAPGSAWSTQLGAVVVADQRAALVGSWTATVTSSAFTATIDGSTESIPKSALSYWSGPATATTGLGTPIPGQLTALGAQSLDAPRTAFSKIAGAGNNSTTWNPTLVMTLPDNAVAGSYSGTITHSVL